MLLLDIALVVPAVFWQRVRNPQIRVVIELSAAIPFVLPFIVIAFGILRLYGVLAPQWLGTPWLLLLRSRRDRVSISLLGGRRSDGRDRCRRLDEAAQLCGANAWQTLRFVVIPHIGPGIATGGMLVFATSFGEFALAQILVGARFETVSLYSLDLLARTNSDFPTLAVLTVLTVVILFAVSVAVVLLDRGQANRLYPGAKLSKQR